MKKSNEIADAIMRTLESPNVIDSNLENANVVDVLSRLASAASRIASGVCPQSSPGHLSLPGTDAVGGRVDSLTEAVMGITGGLVRVAEAIEHLAQAVEDRP